MVIYAHYQYFQHRNIVKDNQRQSKTDDYSVEAFSSSTNSSNAVVADPMTLISDLREYDVPYETRMAIDLDVRVGAWYLVEPLQQVCVCLCLSGYDCGYMSLSVSRRVSVCLSFLCIFYVFLFLLYVSDSISS